jgi:large subunit ribosomal protein L4
VPACSAPQPRDYHFKLNKKVKDLARRSALTHKAKDGAIKVLEPDVHDSSEDQRVRRHAQGLQPHGPQGLWWCSEPRTRTCCSAPATSRARAWCMASEVNTYDIMNAHGVLIVKDAIAPLEATLTK